MLDKYDFFIILELIHTKYDFNKHKIEVLNKYDDFSKKKKVVFK